MYSEVEDREDREDAEGDEGDESDEGGEVGEDGENGEDGEDSEVAQGAQRVCKQRPASMGHAGKAVYGVATARSHWGHSFLKSGDMVFMNYG